VYKNLEEKEVKVMGWAGAAEAVETIEKAKQSYIHSQKKL
jgi:inorganic pyrophosphatase